MGDVYCPSPKAHGDKVADYFADSYKRFRPGAKNADETHCEKVSELVTHFHTHICPCHAREILKLLLRYKYEEIAVRFLATLATVVTVVTIVTDPVYWQTLRRAILSGCRKVFTYLVGKMPSRGSRQTKSLYYLALRSRNKADRDSSVPVSSYRCP